MAEKMVDVINQGGGPHAVSTGVLRPGQSISVPESEAKRLCAYKHIVLASSVIKSVADNEELKKENAELRAQIVALQGKVDEFLGAGKLAELKALQEKHAPAKPEEVPQV